MSRVPIQLSGDTEAEFNFFRNLFRIYYQKYYKIDFNSEWLAGCAFLVSPFCLAYDEILGRQSCYELQKTFGCYLFSLALPFANT